MKTRNLAMTLLAAGLVLASCTSTPKVEKGEYLIEGYLKNVPDSTVIELLQNDGSRSLKVIHKDTVIQGRFSFNDTISGTNPQKLLLFSYSEGFPGTWIDIWIQSGKYVKITGEDCLLPLWKIDSKIAEQQDFNKFLDLCPSERKLAMQWKAQEGDLFRAAQQKEQKLDWKKIDSLRALYDPLDSLIYIAELNYMKKALVTTVWLDKYKLYCSLLQWKPQFAHKDLIRSLYTRMSDIDKATEAGQEITAYLNPPPIIKMGDEMADGDLYDLDGKLRHLSEFKGKYILLDFWSQGCGPCIESLPEMEEITAQYQGTMEVVSINQDSKESWKDFIAKKQLKGNQWNELRNGNTGLAAAYQIKGIPHYVMISPEGKVLKIWSGYGKGSLKAKMKELIKED